MAAVITDIGDSKDAVMAWLVSLQIIERVVVIVVHSVVSFAREFRDVLSMSRLLLLPLSLLLLPLLLLLLLLRLLPLLYLREEWRRYDDP